MKEHVLLQDEAELQKTNLKAEREGVGMIKAAQIDVLKSIVLEVDFVEDLPGNIELDFLAH